MKAIAVNRSRWILPGAAALALLIFLRITRELMEGEVGGLDNAILLAATKIRVPWLTIAAVDVTALGSITVVVLLSGFVFLMLLALRAHADALQLLAASSGAGILALVTKDMIARTRPPEVERLIVVSGFSYPSGHSVATAAVYLTLAIIAGRHVRQSTASALIFVAVATVIILVGASRVYLGVHYATDVVSGLALGTAWAFLLSVLFERFASRAVS